MKLRRKFISQNQMIGVIPCFHEDHLLIKQQQSEMYADHRIRFSNSFFSTQFILRACLQIIVILFVQRTQPTTSIHGGIATFST